MLALTPEERGGAARGPEAFDRDERIAEPWGALASGERRYPR